MKTQFGFLLLLVSFVHGTGQEPIVDPQIMEQIRHGFYVAVEDEDTTVNLMNIIKKEFSDDYHSYPAVILAYYAALEGLRGRHAGNPLTKFYHVSNAIRKMNEAVDKQPDCLEARFLRFSFYQQIPAIFGVRDKVNKDLAIVIDLLEERTYDFVSRAVQKDMIDYMFGTDKLSEEQRERLTMVYNELIENE